MYEILLGEYIKQERIKQGVTQEKLCEGICESITVSRMENGKQMPAYHRIRAFLQRLGLPDDRYFALLSKNELAIKTLEDEIRADIVRLQRAAPEDQPAIRAAGLKKLDKLEQLAEEGDKIIEQCILGERAALGRPDGPYSPEERLEMSKEALYKTAPQCDLEEINLGLYTYEETALLNQIAVAYEGMGQHKKAIDIYSQLLKYVKKHYSEMSRYAGKFSLISCNYALVLYRLGRYDEAIEVADMGRKTCVEYAHYQSLPGLLDIIGGCYFHKGDLERCKEYYRDAYALYRVTGNDRDRISLEKDAKEELGLEFPF
ncbi:MAG: tetratricopeptide repeat protein [Oscillospiraceae bacterium]|jgi:transcriptional regulator with XRE-family HTH domain|nr:tetratricopeptide repeat protein [Oscillospiraceae bacterium]